jgi:hypothetical protein
MFSSISWSRSWSRRIDSLRVGEYFLAYERFKASLGNQINLTLEEFLELVLHPDIFEQADLCFRQKLDEEVNIICGSVYAETWATNKSGAKEKKLAHPMAAANLSNLRQLVVKANHIAHGIPFYARL